MEWPQIVSNENIYISTVSLTIQKINNTNNNQQEKDCHFMTWRDTTFTLAVYELHNW